MQEITPEQLKTWLDDEKTAKPVLLDVREAWETDLCQLSGSILIPMNTISARIDELDPDTETVVICHHGARSFQVGMYLERAGFGRIFNLAGGIDSWARRVDPAVSTY